MNNDLISRSALLKAFANSEHIIETTDGLDVMEMLAIKEVIDNAPTVEYPFYQEAYQTGYEEGKNERPQGEWIDHSEDGYVECPFCEHLTNCEDNIDELHYCWNCGAKMQKGGAK